MIEVFFFCRSCSGLSNAVYRCSLSFLVFELSGGRSSAPPPAGAKVDQTSGRARVKRWDYSAKKTACRSNAWFQRYKLAKSVTAGPGRATQCEHFPLVNDELARPSASLVDIQTRIPRATNQQNDRQLSGLGSYARALRPGELLHEWYQHLTGFAVSQSEAEDSERDATVVPMIAYNF